MKWLLKLIGLERIKEWDEFDPKDDPLAQMARCGGCGQVVRCNAKFQLELHECLSPDQLEEILSMQTKGQDEC